MGSAAWTKTICMGVDLFNFILSGIDRASWMCRLVSVIKFGKFSAIISYDIFCALFSPSHTPIAVC